MKTHLQPGGCWPVFSGLSCTARVLIVLYILIAKPAFTQIDTVNVISDILPDEGNLNHAIQVSIRKGALSKTVFKLEPYGYYILNRAITVLAGEHLPIVASEPGITQATAPLQFVWSSNQNMRANYQFKYEFTLTR